MEKPIVYFSAVSTLAYKINEQFYDGKHFVYCTQYFDNPPDQIFTTPPSSSPILIYERFEKESQSSDRFAFQIESNKIGLRRGAEKREADKIISPKTKKIVLNVIEAAQHKEFEPLLYIIPVEKVKNKLIEVDYNERADPFFDEYTIDLEKGEFTHIKFPRLK